MRGKRAKGRDDHLFLLHVSLSRARVIIILSYYVNKPAPDYHRSCSTGGFATRKSSIVRAVAVVD